MRGILFLICNIIECSTIKLGLINFITSRFCIDLFHHDLFGIFIFAKMNVLAGAESLRLGIWRLYY